MTTEIDTLCLSEAGELARLIREKEISPVQVTEAYLDRIARINPKLNAFVTLAEESAMARAEKAETAIAKGENWGPLHGVPISIKDLNQTAGIRTTGGSRVFEDRVPDKNDPMVARLLDAGAIILGKTNTPEFGWLAITENELFGRSNNPWNVEYTTSGSSGGAAAAAAAGLAAIHQGSDGGGSIRHPAAFCGVFGIKPTFGMVPSDFSAGGWESLSHQGPITWTVADGALAMDVMCGYDPGDFTSAPLPPQNFVKNLERDLKGLRVAWTADLGFAEVDPRVKDAFESAIPAFEELGCHVEQAHPEMGDVREIFKWTMFSELVGGDLQYIDEDGNSKMSEPLTRFVWKRKDILVRDYLAARRKRFHLHSRMVEFFKDYDLLLTPTMAIPPFKHPKNMGEYPHTVNGVEVSSTGWHPFTPPFNLTHQPAATVPCGFTPEGLPVGLQIVGRKYDDLLVMQAAKAFETARPWTDRRPDL